MKYILLIGIIYFIYRFYNMQEKIKKKVSDFPNPRAKEEEQLEDFTDYEELE